MISKLKRFGKTSSPYSPTRWTRGAGRETERPTGRGGDRDRQAVRDGGRKRGQRTHAEWNTGERELGSFIGPGSSAFLKPSCMTNLGLHSTFLCHYNTSLWISQDRLIYASVTSTPQITVVSYHIGFALSMCQPMRSTRKLFRIIFTQRCSQYPNMLPQ